MEGTVCSDPLILAFSKLQQSLAIWIWLAPNHVKSHSCHPKSPKSHFLSLLVIFQPRLDCGTSHRVGVGGASFVLRWQQYERKAHGM